MRILTISPMPPKRDGIATYISDLAREMRRAGHVVGHVTTSRTQTSADRVSVLDGNPAAVRKVVADIVAWRPDVVHVQHAIATYGPQLPAVLGVLSLLRRKNIDVVVTHHEVTRDTDRLGRAGRLYYGVISRLADRLHVHTQGAAERLAQCGVSRERVSVYPHPVFVPDLDEVDATTRADLRRRYAGDAAHVLLLIGYIQVEKGHLEAVEALAASLARRPELRDSTRLVVAGEVRRRPAGFAHFEKADRDYEARVHARVSELGLQDVVTFTGHVPEAEFDAWFRTADIVLLPYQAAEESGIAGHAIAADCPVLAAPVGGLHDLFGGTPLELVSREPDPFSHALEAALDDPAGTRDAAARVHADLRERRSAAGLVSVVAPHAGGSS